MTQTDLGMAAGRPAHRSYRLLFDDSSVEDIEAPDATTAIADRQAMQLPHTVIDLTAARAWAERLAGPRAPRRASPLLPPLPSLEPDPATDERPVWMQRLAERAARRGSTGGRS